MEKKQLKWKPIKMGDKLPCQSFLRKKNGEILKLSTVGGVTVGQDAYYLPVDDVIEEIRNYPIEESEDEGIRKELLAWLKSRDGQILPIDRYNAAIAWLEKQGEHANFINKIQIGDKVTRNEDGILVNLSQLNRVAKKDEKKAEQKPAEWSEIDKYKFDNICSFIQGHTKFSDSCKEDAVNFLQSLKDRVQPQPKQEWSEKDDFMVENVRNSFGLHCGQMTDALKEQYDKFFNKLKSLRPRSQWKPSDEQMNNK